MAALQRPPKVVDLSCSCCVATGPSWAGNSQACRALLQMFTHIAIAAHTILSAMTSTNIYWGYTQWSSVSDRHLAHDAHGASHSQATADCLRLLLVSGWQPPWDTQIDLVQQRDVGQGTRVTHFALVMLTCVLKHMHPLCLLSAADLSTPFPCDAHLTNASRPFQDMC